MNLRRPRLIGVALSLLSALAAFALVVASRDQVNPLWRVDVRCSSLDEENKVWESEPIGVTPPGPKPHYCRIQGTYRAGTSADSDCKAEVVWKDPSGNRQASGPIDTAAGVKNFNINEAATLDFRCHTPHIDGAKDQCQFFR
jgi:hypothetical protein